jgi:hypothetical protein
MLSPEMTAHTQAQLLAARATLSAISARIVELEMLLSLNGQQPQQPSALGGGDAASEQMALLSKLGLLPGGGSLVLPAVKPPAPPGSNVGQPIGIPLVKNMAPAASSSNPPVQTAQQAAHEDAAKVLEVLSTLAPQSKADGPMSANDHLARALANVGASGSLARIRQQSADLNAAAPASKRQRS